MNWIDTSFAFESVDRSVVSYFKKADDTDALIYSYHFSTLPELISLIDSSHSGSFSGKEKIEIAKAAFRNRPADSLPESTGERDIVDFVYEF